MTPHNTLTCDQLRRIDDQGTQLIPSDDVDEGHEYNIDDYLTYAYKQGQDDYREFGQKAECPFSWDPEVQEWERGFKTEEQLAWFRRHGLE